MKHLYSFLFLLLTFSIHSQDDKFLAERPPLGWNSYDSYAIYLHEEAAYKNLYAFAEKLKPFGYEYFVIDAGWYGEYKLVPGTLYPMEKHAKVIAMDEYGRQEPSKTYFPNGLKPLIDKAHELGIKFGVHMMRGIPREAVKRNTPIYGTKYRARDIADTTNICTWNNHNYGIDVDKPGALEYYNSVYQKLADWGVDFVKVDDLVHYPKEIVAIGNAIKNTGREMVYSVSPGTTTNLKDLPYYKKANIVRTTGDIWDDQKGIDESFAAMRKWQGIGYPGFWPDLDMIPFGQLLVMKPIEFKSSKELNQSLVGRGFNRFSELNDTQKRTFITQRALMASPLILGGDIPTLDEYSLSLITDRDMLACNQNGNPATLIAENGQVEVWGTAKLDQTITGWIGIFNRSENIEEIELNKKSLGLENFYHYSKNHKMRKVFPNDFLIKNIWEGSEFVMKNNDDIKVKVQPGDVIFISYREILNQ